MPSGKLKEARKIICKQCEAQFDHYRNSPKEFCDILCRKKYNKLKEVENLEHGYHYLICHWDGMPVRSNMKRYVNYNHKDRGGYDQYKKEFPHQLKTVPEYKDKTIVSGEDHYMKREKYRKMQSERVKGKGNPNHKSNTTELERQERSPFSLEFYKDSDNPEEEYQDFLNYVKNECRKPENYNTKIEYYLEQTNGDYKRAKSLLSERQVTFSLDICIEKYGEEKGRRIFEERQEKWIKSLHKNFRQEGDGRSPSSKFANDCINEICKELDIKVPKKEKFITDGQTKKSYSYDFTLKGKRKIIEFNGDYWHMNPSKYEVDDYNKNKEMEAREIWEYDKEKIKTAEKYNYEVLTVWESEYYENRNEIINKCLNFLSK